MLLRNKMTKRFQDSSTLECIVLGTGKRTICNFSGDCRDCPKYKKAKKNLRVNGIGLTKEEETLFKHLLDTGMVVIEEDQKEFERAKALMKKLGIFNA